MRAYLFFLILSVVLLADAAAAATRRRRRGLSFADKTADVYNPTDKATGNSGSTDAASPTDDACSTGSSATSTTTSSGSDAGGLTHVPLPKLPNATKTNSTIAAASNSSVNATKPTGNTTKPAATAGNATTTTVSGNATAPASANSTKANATQPTISSNPAAFTDTKTLPFNTSNSTTGGNSFFGDWSDDDNNADADTKPPSVYLNEATLAPLDDGNFTTLLPPEGDQPATWPLTVLGIFFGLALVLCGLTGYRHNKKRASYEEIQSLVV